MDAKRDDVQALRRPTARPRAVSSKTGSTSSVSPSPRKPWYRRDWVLGLAGLVFGVAIGAAATSQQVELGEARADVERLGEQLETMRLANADLATENTELQTEIGGSEDRVAELEAEVARLEVKLEKARDKTTAEPRTPNAGVFDVDYSEWSGLFRISGLTLKYDFGWEVLGQIEYLGGGDCPLGYVEVEATYFSGNTIIDSDYTNFTSLPEGTPRVLEIFGPEQQPTRVQVTMAEASCS
jgi:hypothetical protein